MSLWQLIHMPKLHNMLLLFCLHFALAIEDKG